MRTWLGILVATLAATVTAPPTLAQIPDEFTNLQLLPEGTSRNDLVSIMREFTSAVGGRCHYCHVPGDNPESLEGYDFASDDVETKQVARAMMKMTREINDKLLPATGRSRLLQVRCVTCHRGVGKPQTLDRMLLAVTERQDVAAAEARYRKLRDEYYGTGAYDFSARTLTSVAERLAQERQDVDGAIQLMELNVEFHDDDALSYMMLGQLYASKHDTAAAKAALERSLEIEPNNRRARRMLERLAGSE